jgi:hypothetical protein
MSNRRCPRHKVFPDVSPGLEPRSLDRPARDRRLR